ncbi:hypothetical protein SDC9_62255 [bioreactor metagenome]|uniref:Flagellar operon protein TIGR03826 n=1 Tax=bioreactor metagenome TaxID=1076179 RepID=A0A644XJA9_9ZZZZ
MALTKCELCELPFNSFGSKVCASCSHELDQAYVTVRKFIYQNPDKADFANIVAETGVAEKLLSHLIDQGRVLVNDTKGRGSRCRACGKPTGGNVLCDSCRSKLISQNLMPGGIGAQKPAQPPAERSGARPIRIQPLKEKKD